MLIGREVECKSIDLVLSESKAGRSRTLVLWGEPGIGKSALLSYAESKADGWRVLRAAGSESEVELPFAALDLLLRPIGDLFARIPEAQAQALEAALALGAPAPADRFTAAVGTLSVLAASAEEAPLLCLIDDAHLLDTSSAAALVFACRRFRAERIAVLFAAREGERREFDAHDLPQRRVAGLGESSARSILTQVPFAIARDAITTIIKSAQGNPLALLELPSALTQEQRAGAEVLPEPLPVTAKLERAFLGRAKALPTETQRALTVAAATDEDELKPLLRALERLHLAADVLVPAETAGLLTFQEGRFAFRHPLVRSALYHAADAGARRTAHRVLAETLVAPEHRVRRAWHLAQATILPDDAIAKELEAAADESRLRGAYATAAIAYERSAQLSDDREARARRLLAASEMLWFGGQGARAKAVVDDALNTAVDPLLRADVERMLARISTLTGPVVDASTRLREAAERIATIDPTRGALLMAEAVLPCMISGDIALALTTSSRAIELAGHVGGLPAVLARLGLGQVLALQGEGIRAHELLEGVRAALDKGDPFGPGAILTQIASCYLWLENYGEAREIITNVVSAARTRGTVVVLPFALAVLSDYECRVGNFRGAYAAASESVTLAHETDQDAEAAFSYASLARAEAVLGHADECRAHAERAFELAGRVGAASVQLYSRAAIGLLELGLGRPAAALASLVRLAREALDQGLGEPATIQWGPDLIAAHVEVDALVEAEAALADFSRQAQRTGRTWALATAARCRGLLASDEEFGRHFEEALAWHDRTPTPFETARTELSYGQRLRRAGLRRKSRDLLRAALATFEQLGATPWARRAENELRASGERVQRRKTSAAEKLTAQELQVALIVAEGATNREAAAQLFLSPKTIEFHLSNIFRKLGLRSRTELARRLARGGAAAILAFRLALEWTHVLRETAGEVLDLAL